MPHSAESDMGLHCVHMSNKKDAERIFDAFFYFCLCLLVVGGWLFL